jgi:hypothetical protein
MHLRGRTLDSGISVDSTTRALGASGFDEIPASFIWRSLVPSRRLNF